MAQQQKAIARPNINSDDRTRAEEETQVETALAVIELLGHVRQASEAGQGEGLNPKEEGAYASALDKLERYLDRPCNAGA